MSIIFHHTQDFSTTKTKNGCIYFTAAFDTRFSPESLLEHVTMMADYYGTTVIHNEVMETNTLVMTMHGHFSDVYIEDRLGFFLHDHPKGSIIKMDTDKWMPLFECDKNVVTQILEAEYDDESMRLKELWVHLGFDEVVVVCDNNNGIGC
jgi:hypothetical protein